MFDSVQVTEKEVQRRKAYLQITKEDEERIRRAHAIIQRHADLIIEEFYTYLLSHEHTRKILEAPGVLERVKRLQKDYFDRLTQGTYDVDYFKDRLRIGHAHDRIGLSPEWYLGAYNRYLTIVSDVLSREMGRDYQGFFDTIVSLTKVIYLDMGLAMDAYISAGRKALAERNQKLEQLDSKKQLLTDTIIHDLRNPIAGIQGFLTVLKSSGTSFTESQRNAMSEAERACTSLNSMIDNVLAISRMEEGKLDVVLERVDVNDLASELARAYEPFARSRGKTIRTKTIGSDLLARTDRGLLHRILANLVMNSIRHATGANFVEIETRRDGDGSVEVSVADDGPGIAAEHQSVIFEKFGGVNLRRTGLKLDTGLGLVFCRMATRELGAELKLESEKGQGARFTVSLRSSR